MPPAQIAIAPPTIAATSRCQAVRAQTRYRYAGLDRPNYKMYGNCQGSVTSDDSTLRLEW